MRNAILEEHYSCSFQKKTLGKTPNNRKNETILKIDHLSKAIHGPCKGYSLCKMLGLGQNLKMPKTWEKPSYTRIRAVLCKKLPLKGPNIRQMRQL